MPNIDVNILEERKNISKFLRNLEKKCLLQSDEREQAFQLLIKVWDSINTPLFDFGYWHDFSELGYVVMRAAQELNKVGAEAQAINEIGWVNMEWGNFDLAETNFIKALQKYELLNDAHKQCRTLRYLGVLYYRKNEREISLNYYRQALDIAAKERTQSSGQDRNAWTFSEAELRNMFGIYYLDQNDLATSYQELSYCLELYRSIEDTYYQYYQTAPLLNLGKWYFVQQDYQKAKNCYQESLNISRKIDRTDMIAGALLRLAEVAEAEGNDLRAIELATEAEQAAGTEITVTREAAAHFKERILEKNHS
ncbi:tetratricopeptide repeat protein [Microcoleus sp. Pol12B4]|uniref:tetratricopeptide repeat protein n=1 Tax=Microcoleus sp. Pol12B4 TaxID=3055395 RepID=UPI002FD10F52